jgi:hypothetical protein
VGRLWNNRGSAMIASMLASVLVVGASAVAFRNYNINHDSVRVARIKNLMNFVDLQVRRRALQPEGYVNCNSAVGTGNCAVAVGFFTDLDRNVPGAKCAGGPNTCGVRVENTALDTVNRIFTARITYYGNDAKLKPIDVSIRVPTEILQSTNFTCPGDRPFFSGFLASGAPDCQPFLTNGTYQGNQCIAGHFVRRINVSARTVECSPLPPVVQCGDQNAEKFRTLTWVNGVPSFTCRGLDTPPFTQYRNFRIPGTAPPPVINTPVITFSNVPLTETQTNMVTATETVTVVVNTPTPEPPPPPPGPVCNLTQVHVGASPLGSTPRVFGNFACHTSCKAAYGNSALCAGGCYQGYRGWMFCNDCIDERVVCN